MTTTYNYFGMHLFWWFAWAVMVFWIFATPYDIPGQMNKKDSPLELLKKRFASGQITAMEYEEAKHILDI